MRSIWTFQKKKKRKIEDELEQPIRRMIENSPYTLIQYFYDINAFGNIIVIVEYNDIQLRFIRDRGDAYCELGIKNITDSWIDFEPAMRCMKFKIDQLPLDFLKAIEIVLSIDLAYIDKVMEYIHSFSFSQLKRQVSHLQRINSPFN